MSGLRWNSSLLIRSLLPKDPARKLVTCFSLLTSLSFFSHNAACCLSAKSLHQKVEHLPSVFAVRRTALYAIVLFGFATGFPGLVESGAEEPERPDAPEAPQGPVKQNLKVISAQAPYRVISGGARAVAARETFGPQSFLLGRSLPESALPATIRGIRPALDGICQTLRNAFHGCSFQSHD